MTNGLFDGQYDDFIAQLSHVLSLKSSEEFFPSLTKYLAQVLHADYALIGELTPGEQLKVKSLGFAIDGELAENFTYLLENTPCEQVVAGKARVFESGVQKLFPRDNDLVDMNVEGYAGIPLRRANGEVLGHVCVFYRDIVARPTQVEQVLQLFAGRASSELERLINHESLRRFYESSPLSYQSLDKEGQFLNVNPAWVETFGYQREEVLGRRFSDFMTVSSAELASERFPVLKEQGTVSDVSFELIHREGHLVRVTLHGRSSYDKLGTFLHTNCILIDVTAAHEAEKQLRKSEEMNRLLSRQFQTLLDGIPDRILLLDTELRIIWTNQKNAPSGEVFKKIPKGRPCYEVMHGRLEACPECPAIRCLETGDVVHHERVNPDGCIWLQRAFPILDDDGNIFSVIEIGQDITEKIKLQKDTVRTGQLAALGELAAGVAHEINNPINGVINYAQLLQNRTAPESEERDLSDRIIKEGDRIARIVKQLLFLSRNDSTEKQALDLTEVLSESLSLVGSQLNNEGIDLEVSLQEGLPTIQGHAQQLEQLFLNIISNSRHALNQRFPQSCINKRLDVNLACEESDSGSYLVVCFRDQGVGIEPELIDKVLQPFVTSKPSAEGTGLGLSLSNDIVKNHGGSLHVASELGRYTEVTARLPV